LGYYYGDKYVTDTAPLKDGLFLLKGKTGDPAIATLEVNPPPVLSVADIAKLGRRLTAADRTDFSKLDRQEFYLEATDIQVTGDAGVKTAMIKAGTSQRELEELTALHRQEKTEMAQLSLLMQKYHETMNDTGMQRLQKEAEALTAKSKQVDSVFIKSHPGSYVAFDLFRKKLRGPIDLSVVEAPFNGFSEKIRRSEEGKRLARRIAVAKRIDTGKPAVDFTLKDTLGQPVVLSSLKGKNVLVFFWYGNVMNIQSAIASVGRVSKKFRDRNLVVLGVSYDRSQEAWLSYIKQYSMNWINVFDRDGITPSNRPDSYVAKEYDISWSTIPRCLLLDTNGIILAKNLRPDNTIDQKIAKLITP
jgi:peroxiredoxin